MSAGYCPNCGAAAAAGASFCAACGKPLAASPAGAATAAAHPGARPPDAPEAEVLEIRPLVVRTLLELLVCVLTLGIAWVVWWLARMRLRFVLTTQRIERREGLVTVRRTSLDLFRIEDFEVVEPFFLRMRGAGDLRIWSMDKDEPDLVMPAVPNVTEVYEKVRTLTRAERSRAQVRVIEGDVR
jgi:uncharacterized membrane protein YdbT with pleckstrin-like domain